MSVENPKSSHPTILYCIFGFILIIVDNCSPVVRPSPLWVPVLQLEFGCQQLSEYFKVTIEHG
jgi:hypothetical protein